MEDRQTDRRLHALEGKVRALQVQLSEALELILDELESTAGTPTAPSKQRRYKLKGVVERARHMTTPNATPQRPDQ